MNKNDLRAQRTFHKINKNFRLLMGKIGYRKLNVAMITDKAKMNRSTFYSHFRDKRNLYEYHLGLIVDSFDFRNYDEFVGKKEMEEERLNNLTYLFEESLVQIQNDKDFVLAMIDVEDVHKMTKAYMNMAHVADDKIVIETRNGTQEVPTSLIINYALGVLVFTLRWWLNDSSNHSVKDVADILATSFINIPLKSSKL
ncbi:MAG TPA: TetR/AcrR family transcriptional regulator [Erysipelothrix sp.]|jgi:AcrR family transcriptional regulator|nr:TetR/AcrR family transcriptional regulator [Erysipelothrix sp.]